MFLQRRRFLSYFTLVLSFASCCDQIIDAKPAIDGKSVTTAKEPVWKSSPGPWGDLEIRAVYLEAPDSLITTFPKPNSTTRWCFPKATEASLRELCEKASLPAATRERLLNPQRMLVQEGIITLFPQLEDLEALTSDQRSVIYNELAKSPLNEYQKDPVFIAGGDLEDWLRETHLSPQSREMIRKMTWRRGNALVFSDISALLSQAQNDLEVQNIFKTTTRTRTLLVNLKVQNGVDLKSLAEYWTASGRFTDDLPLLESAANRNSVTELDITHLLPFIPRRRLYTYPTADLATRGRLPDCHWTSLNFFNEFSQNYYLDTRLASNDLMENYLPVNPAYTYGDVIVFLNTAGQAIHSCVFIADDIVFTKNGENSLTPWVLMQLKDVKDIYLNGPDWHLQGYRLKPEQKLTLNFK